LLLSVPAGAVVGWQPAAGDRAVVGSVDRLPGQLETSGRCFAGAGGLGRI